MRIDASSPAVESALRELVELAVSAGVEVHPDMRLREHDGHMSIHADASDGELLIRLPQHLLVPMDGAVWDVVDDRLVITQHAAAATSEQRELAEAIARVYDVTDKVEWAMTSLPRAALRDSPEAVEAIRSIRPDFGARSAPVADAFLQTRVLRWPVDPERSDAEHGRFLMPIVDLINHHAQGASWRRMDDVLSIAVAHATGDSECLVRYRARQDPLDVALGYGFVDDSCTLVRSVPATVEVHGLGVVEVAAHRVEARTALDPPTVEIEAGRLRLSHVTFDADHPDRLAGMLRLAVAAFIARQGSASACDASTATSTLVESLLDANLIDLEHARVELERELGGSPAAATVLRAIEEQVRLLSDFRKNLAGIPQV